MLNWLKKLFSSRIPAPEVGQVWISMHSERCIRIHETHITDSGTFGWSEQIEDRGPPHPMDEVAMCRRFIPLPMGTCYGLDIWRRTVRRNRLVLLGTPEYIEAYRIKHGSNCNPPPWSSRPATPKGPAR